MAGRGKTHGQIAVRVGFATSTVRRWLDPEYDEACRQVTMAYRRANRAKLNAYYRQKARERKDGTCSSCGSPVAKEATAQCANCRRADKEFLWADIARLWNDEGKTVAEIAAFVGKSVPAVGQHMVRMRKAGVFLPKRRH